MVNWEHLAYLQQGAEEWNGWRILAPDIPPDVRGADLRGLNLYGANLHGVDLSETDLTGAILREADLGEANLTGANLSHANLYLAELMRANLSGATLHHTNFRFAYLINADFSEANLQNANLSEADLSRACFNGANLNGTVFTHAFIGQTSFLDVDLGSAIGLEYVEHWYPSNIDIFTLLKSRAHLPEIFLKNCGLSRSLIEYARSIIDLTEKKGTCFVSYAHKDQEFATRLHKSLQEHGCYSLLAPEALKGGECYTLRINLPARQADRVLLILSSASVASEWIASEVNVSLECERRWVGNPTLFVVKLDDSIEEIDSAWAVTVRQKRPIIDYSNWRVPELYDAALHRLLRIMHNEG